MISRASRRREPGLEQRLAGDDKGRSSNLGAAYRRAAPVLDGAWQMVASAALGTLGGRWLDGKLGTGPWLLLVGAVLGVSAGMYAFIRAALRMGDASRRKR